MVSLNVKDKTNSNRKTFKRVWEFLLSKSGKVSLKKNTKNINYKRSKDGLDTVDYL